MAYFAERAESYAFYEVDVWMKSLSTLIIAIITLVVLLFWHGGTDVLIVIRFVLSAQYWDLSHDIQSSNP